MEGLRVLMCPVLPGTDKETEAQRQSSLLIQGLQYFDQIRILPTLFSTASHFSR